LVADGVAAGTVFFICELEGPAAIFTPTGGERYASPSSTEVSHGQPTCGTGKSRPERLVRPDGAAAGDQRRAAAADRRGRPSRPDLESNHLRQGDQRKQRLRRPTARAGHTE